MPSLVDIAPVRQPVTIQSAQGPVEIQCGGLSLEAIAHVLHASSDLRSLLSEGVMPTPVVLLTRMPDVAHMVMAAGVGKLHDTDEEAAAGRLVIEDQVELLTAIFRLTFPGGMAPFFEKIGRIAGTAGLMPFRNGADVAGKEPDTSSPLPPTS